jgi:hypothetical protein
MTKDLCSFFKNAIEYAGEEAEIQEDYSGRGMYGQKTRGIVFNSETILMENVLGYIRDTGVKIPADFGHIRTDNMGRDVIWY